MDSIENITYCLHIKPVNEIRFMVIHLSLSLFVRYEIIGQLNQYPLFRYGNVSTEIAEYTRKCFHNANGVYFKKPIVSFPI